MVSKITEQIKAHINDIYWVVCGILAGIIGYHMGLSTALRSHAVMIRTDAAILEAVAGSKNIQTGSTGSIISHPAPHPADNRVVASKSASSKLYHYSWCPGAQRIKLTNQLWFENEKAAQVAGYTLAGNCQ